jgi:hypothetical protein
VDKLMSGSTFLSMSSDSSWSRFDSFSWTHGSTLINSM